MAGRAAGGLGPGHGQKPRGRGEAARRKMGARGLTPPGHMTAASPPATATAQKRSPPRKGRSLAARGAGARIAGRAGHHSILSLQI